MYVTRTLGVGSSGSAGRARQISATPPDPVFSALAVSPASPAVDEAFAVAVTGTDFHAGRTLSSVVAFRGAIEHAATSVDQDSDTRVEASFADGISAGLWAIRLTFSDAKTVESGTFTVTSAPGDQILPAILAGTPLSCYAAQNAVTGLWPDETLNGLDITLLGAYDLAAGAITPNGDGDSVRFHGGYGSSSDTDFDTIASEGTILAIVEGDGANNNIIASKDACDNAHGFGLFWQQHYPLGFTRSVADATQIIQHAATSGGRLVAFRWKATQTDLWIEDGVAETAGGFTLDPAVGVDLLVGEGAPGCGEGSDLKIAYLAFFTTFKNDAFLTSVWEAMNA